MCNRLAGFSLSPRPFGRGFGLFGDFWWVFERFFVKLGEKRMEGWYNTCRSKNKARRAVLERKGGKLSC